MSVIINASTTSGLVMTSDLSGTLSLQSNGVAVTVPAVAGTMMVSGNMPAFSAYASVTQTIAQNTFVKVLFDTEEFDTNNNFASSRFTPTVAGYYQVNAAIEWTTSQGSFEQVLCVTKNGSNYKTLADVISPVYALAGACLIYLNGSTDYIEIAALTANTGTRTINLSSQYTWFQACLVRGA
jgi:hypothetical protein